MNYIKEYIKNYGAINYDFNIHHIDIDRKNNKLNNLVAIPMGLHKKYHSEEKKMIKCFKSNNIIGFYYHRDMLINLYDKIMYYKTKII